MINLMAWLQLTGAVKAASYVHTEPQSLGTVRKYLKAQIDNSLDLGWEAPSLALVTDFPFSYRGVSAIRHDDIVGACFINKWTALRQVWRTGIRDHVWYHDVDAWQLEPFAFPAEVSHVGFVPFAHGLHGGSVLVNARLGDMLDEYIGESVARRIENDELLWTEWQRGKYAKQISLLDATYNVGRTGFERRHRRASKPVKVIHLKPDEDWNKDVKVDGTLISANAFLTPPRLRRIFEMHEIWHPGNRRVRSYERVMSAYLPGA